MSANKERAYETPEIELLDIAVEAGFAASTGAEHGAFDTNDTQDDTSAWS